jgi:rubrerythrin
MISKQYVKNYLDKMLKLELDMQSVYDKLSKEVKDTELKQVFEKLTKDESEHALLVKTLQNLLINWK